nr:YolD-like family protein [Lederbergia lenta]
MTKGQNLRWESSRMMLPEHVEQFIQFKNNEGRAIKPELDEQKLEEINEILNIAIEDDSPIYLDVYNNGKIKTIMCYVDKFDQLKSEIKFIVNGEFEKVKVENIIDVKVV